jgi:hypothetical protein
MPTGGGFAQNDSGAEIVGALREIGAFEMSGGG